MILVDANLLIYAVNLDAPRHEHARRWLEDTLSGTELVGLPWVCLLAFLRITTHPRVLARPLSVEAAGHFVQSWLDEPIVEPVAPSAGHWEVLYNLIRVTGTGGNLTTDAHIAAMAIERGALVYSADFDFRRFPGVRHVNPLDPPPDGP